MIYQGIIYGILGFVWSVVLTVPGGFLSFIPKPNNWLRKPLFDCYNCVAGQFALWGFLIFNEWDLLNHLGTIGVSILTAFFLGEAKMKLDIKKEIKRLNELKRNSR